MKLYAVTLSAVRDRDGENPEVSMLNTVALLFDDQDIEVIALKHAHEVFPDADCWLDHMTMHTEIRSGAMFAHYQLTWQVTEEVMELADA